jgi:large subunit ribosomal protein L5
MRLKVKYKEEIHARLKEQLGWTTRCGSRPGQIVLNMGLGEAVQNKRRPSTKPWTSWDSSPAETACEQGPQSIANFKLREGMPIGVSVTLRGARMWEFFDRLLSVAIPRVRDFRGLNPRAFDGRGNYSVGASEQLIFPEIDFDSVTETRGMNITIVTTAENDEAGKALLDAFGFPFRKVEAQV